MPAVRSPAGGGRFALSGPRPVGALRRSGLKAGDKARRASCNWVASRPAAPAFRPLGPVVDSGRAGPHTGYLLQAIFNKPRRGPGSERLRDSETGATLLSLREGEHGIVERFDLPEEAAVRIMALGLAPGSRVTAVRSAPGGDPRVYRVDGAEIALRGETAAQVRLRRAAAPEARDERVP